MTAPETGISPEHRSAEARRKRATLIFALIAALCVIVPYLFWQGTWFGRPLTEEEVSEYLADTEKPRHIQHALVQISERITRGDASVKRWYPEVLALADSPHPEIRVTLAWVLGADNRSAAFHETLRDLLEDADPMVRRNAALSLVRFGDSSGRPELLKMLQPYTIRAPQEGTVRYRLEKGNAVDQGTLLARLETGKAEEPVEIRSPLPGTLQERLLEDGSQVSPGDELLVLSPGSEHAWEALRALYLVGEREDLQPVERFARNAPEEMPENVRQQALLTAEQIRRRTRNP